MRSIILLIILPVLLSACALQQQSRRETYSWLTIQVIPRDSTGKIKGSPGWPTPWRIVSPVDTFVFFLRDDSIRMISADAPYGNLFTKVQIHATRWKPKTTIGDSLQFMGTYERERLLGIYFSFYWTKDRRGLLLIEYTNPGNMISALLFARDSMAMRLKDGVNFNPAAEMSEPEKPALSSQ
jgi:hypothetical protein